MNLKSAFFIMLFLASAFLYGQDSNSIFKDKVFLTNGSVLVGKITFYDPDSRVELELQGGSVLSFTSIQVKRVMMYEEIKNLHQVTPFKIKKVYVQIIQSKEHISLSINFIYFNRKISPDFRFSY